MPAVLPAAGIEAGGGRASDFDHETGIFINAQLFLGRPYWRRCWHEPVTAMH